MIKNKILWLTGLSGSGKTSLSQKVGYELTKKNTYYIILDADIVRKGLNSDLGFSDEDRQENIRRVGELAKLLYDSGLIVICAFISPFEKDRNRVRNLIPEGDFIEIYLDCPLFICEQRDIKGLYKKARKRELTQFTGIDSKYEIPKNPEIVLDTNNLNPEECVERIMKWLIPYS
jgi:adenylylsulfate kinase